MNNTVRRLILFGGRTINSVINNITVGQLTKFAVGDSGDTQFGIPTAYSILTTGQYSGTVNLDVAHYAAATIAFVSATKKITDSANGLITVLTGDTIVIWGSASNNGVYTVATGGVTGEIVTTQALVDESAGAYVTILKRASHSNNAVLDLNTLLMWSRYTSKGEKLGIASGGKLTWNDPATSCTLHPAAADLAISATTKILKIVGGAGEVARYKPATHLVFSGFANAGNNLAGGYRVESVAVNDADLDIQLWTGFSTANPLTTEAAGGSRTIKLVTNNIFAYAAAANAVALGGYTDWRVPDDKNMMDIRDMEPPTAAPNAAAFPSWPTDDYIWSATTLPGGTSNAMLVYFSFGNLNNYPKTSVYYAALLRGA